MTVRDMDEITVLTGGFATGDSRGSCESVASNPSAARASALNGGLSDGDSLSVVIPAYNAERWIERCLKSALRCSSRSLEVICVDDGSTDGSWAVMSEIAESDARVKLIRQSNQGRCAARNAGLAVATGEWVVFLDADDMLIPGSVDAVLGASDADVPLICTLGTYAPEAVDEKPARRASGTAILSAVEALKFLQAPVEIAQSLSDGSVERHALQAYDPIWCQSSCTKIIRRSVVTSGSVAFERGLKYGEDILFLHDLLTSADFDVLFVPTVTHWCDDSTPGTTRTYREGDISALRRTFAAWGSRRLDGEAKDYAAWRCVADALYISMMAAVFLPAPRAKSEISELFEDKHLKAFCERVPQSKLRNMGAVVWRFWSSAFDRLKASDEGGFWRSVSLLAAMKKVLLRFSRQ